MGLRPICQVFSGDGKPKGSGVVTGKGEGVKTNAKIGGIDQDVTGVLLPQLQIIILVEEKIEPVLTDIYGDGIIGNDGNLTGIAQLAADLIGRQGDRQLQR